MSNICNFKPIIKVSPCYGKNWILMVYKMIEDVNESEVIRKKFSEFLRRLRLRLRLRLGLRLVVKAPDSQSRSPVFKTTGSLQGRLNYSLEIKAKWYPVSPVICSLIYMENRVNLLFSGGNIQLWFSLLVSHYLVFNPFHAMGLFLYSLKGGIERDQWHKTG